MTSLPSNFLSLLLIPLAPWTLERAARQARLSHAVVLSIIAGPLTLALVLGVAFAGFGEPYTSLTSYVRGIMGTVGCMFFPALLICGPIVNGLWNEVLLDSCAADRRRARRCVILLSPLTLLIPALVWATAAAVRSAASPSFQLGTPKPDWLTSAVTQSLASMITSPIWSFALPLVAALHTAFVFRRMNFTSFPDESHLCSHCSYPLSSLPPNSPCPECGALSEP